MANYGPQWVGDERVGVGAGPTQMSASKTQRSRPKTHFLASRGRLKQKTALCVREARCTLVSYAIHSFPFVSRQTCTTEKR